MNILKFVIGLILAFIIIKLYMIVAERLGAHIVGFFVDIWKRINK